MSTTTQAPISVQQHPLLGPSVSGRELYSKIAVSLASRDIFSDWFRDKQRKLDLVEGKDFVTTSINVSGTSRKHIEHILTIDAAQKMAEIALARRGVEVASYLKHYVPEVEELVQSSAHAEAWTTLQKDVTLVLDPSVIPDNIHPRSKDVPQGFASLLERPYRRVYEEFQEEASAKTPAQKLLAEALRLVEAEQNHKSEPEVLPEQLRGLEARLNRLENSTNIILYFFQQASTALRTLPPVQLPVVAEASTAALPDLEPTKREKVRRLVDGYAAAKTVSHQEVWKHLYGHLSSRFGFDAWQHAEGKKDPNYLEIVEKNGQLENLYSIAVELLTLSQR